MALSKKTAKIPLLRYVLRSMHITQEGKILKRGDVISLSVAQLPNFVNKIVRAPLSDTADEDVLVGLSVLDEDLVVDSKTIPSKASIT